MRDVAVSAADDVTVGELADALFGTTSCGLVQRWPVSGDALARDAPVAAVGPTSGSTVELAANPATTRTASPAPASLVGNDTHRLRYGRNSVEGLELDVGRDVVLSTRSSAPVRVEGERLVGSRRLGDGERVSRSGDLFTLQLHGPLRPPPHSGPTRLHLRTPRHLRAHTPTTIELPTPPARTRLPRLPVVSALVPLLMGAGLWLATRSVLASGFMLFSTAFVVAAGIEARRDARAEQRFRVEEFRSDLADAAAAASRARVAQHARLDDAAPGGDATARFVEAAPERVWERVDGSVVVRVGDGPVSAEDQVRAPTTGRRDLRDEATAVAAAHSPFRGPLLVDVARSGGLAVVGPDERPTALARSLVVQLCATLTPGQLSLDVVAGPGRSRTWRWCEWLPHRAGRSGTQRTLRVVDQDADATATAGDGELLLWLAPTAAGLPDHIGAVVDLDDRGASVPHLDLRDDDGNWSRRPLERPDVLDEDLALSVARRLSALTCDRQGPGEELHSDGLKGVLDDPELIADPTRVAALWSTSTSANLGAPVGWAGSGVAHLDLVADGPHALVAGTTGAGKSELLRTLICSMSMHHPPDRVSFLLVDYKGGAAFRPLVGLPHVVGMITDLGGDLARRALVSLRAEVRRRERTLAEHRASDLEELREMAPAAAAASLVVVVDEFATLARELPDFVDGLVDVAQRGRSLGIHLVLATQRPAGVVTDNIKANTSLRIALRVADADESRDVVDVADAAELPRDQPGAAVVRLGPGTTTSIRFAHTGAPYAPPDRISVSPLGSAAARTSRAPTGPVQLDLAVATVATAASNTGARPPHRPWLDPLPDVLPFGEIAPDDRPGQLTVGTVDVPEAQRRAPLRVDLTQRGGVVVSGAGGSGRTTVLRALALAAARHRAERIDVRMISSSPSTATSPGEGQVVGDVVAVDDAERVLRLLRSLVAPRATSERSRDRTILMVDGLAAFYEAHERLRRAEAVDLLHRVAREGPRRGVHVVVTAGRRSEVPAPLAAALGATITLRCPNEDEALLVGLDAQAAAPSLPPGRCWFDGHLCQIALPDPRLLPAGWAPPPPVPSLPDVVTTEQLDGAVLLDADELEPVELDESRHLVVAGPPGSGVSDLLDELARSSGASVRVGAPDRSRPLTAATAAALRAATGTVVIDDLPSLLDHAEHGRDCAAALGEVITGGTARIIAGGEIDALLRCYDDVVTRLRSLRHGVLLHVDPDVHATLLHADIAPRPELPVGPTHGWLVEPDRVRAVMAASSC